MSATYNWAYRPGVNNNYGVVIPNTDDNVKPNGFVYVALFGNDTTGNGSRMYPYKTISRASQNGDGGDKIILASGTYRNETASDIPPIFGDGDVIIDGFLMPAFYMPYGRNLQIINAHNSPQINNSGDNIFIGDGLATTNLYNGEPTGSNNIYSNFATINLQNGGPINLQKGFNTFVDIGELLIEIGLYGGNYDQFGILWFCIFDGCNITFDGVNCNIDYCLFNNCKFRVSSGAYTEINNIADLQAMVQTFSPGNTSFSKSTFADPKFNNRSIGDFTLAFDSPAKNMSPNGACIGARSIAYKINAVAGSGGAFDLSTAINVTLGDDSIEFADDTMDGQIDTLVIPNIIKRELRRIPSYGTNADRNGQYIDSIPDLSETSISPGTDLSEQLPYLVENGAIEYNGASYADGDRFTTVIGITSFTSSAGGTVREITEAPQRHTVMMRASDGELLESGASLTDGFWYYVAGTITHDGNDYTNQSFKATANSGFTGGGVLEFCFNATDGWQHYEPGIKPTSNNVGNARLGDIIRGNGDPNYDRGGIGVTEFPINSKFLQIRYYLRHANLRP